ncbi:MAG TPA: aldo/keto reductase [Gammaproteobacteria bacterium]|nr:aldo/keto reductase [Gammaproteobacteria bacterium]
MSELPRSTLGRTGLEVTKLGYGAMELRGTDHFPRLSAAEASAILNAVLDSGINYIDTSPDYGYSEELIGRHIAHRRDEFFLASKCGCPVEPPDLPHAERKPHSFTRENIRAGVEQSLKRMQTDYLDVVQFHISPARAVLEENNSIAELETLRREGKVRFIGMSGTDPELSEHIEMGVFDVFQIPYSLVEREHESLIHEAARRGAGIVIRGGVARGVIVKDESIIDDYPDFLQAGFRARRRRWLEAEVESLLGDMTPMEFMLRFTISNPDMSTTIVGTANPAHLEHNVEVAARGPLPKDLYAAARKWFGATAPALSELGDNR